MKIVYCIPHLYKVGGMERVLTEKANFLSKAGHNIVVVTTESAPKDMPLSSYPLEEKIRIEELHINFDAGFGLPPLRKIVDHQQRQRRYKKRLTALLQAEQPDLCVSLCGKEIEWIGGAALPCPVAAELHFSMDYRAQLLQQYHDGKLWQLAGRRMTRSLIRHIRRVRHLVVLTEADRQAWLRADMTRVSCIPNPSPIAPSAEGTHTAKQVLAVGRLHPQKGFDLLLQAWQQVAAQHPDWTLRIAGEGPMRPELEKQIQSSRLEASVRMEGLSQNLQKDYQESALFVLSSRYEGLPLALIEAMSQGCCCIACDCPQGPAELIRNEQNGLLLPNGDVQAMADAINRLIAQPDTRATWGSETYDEAVRRFALAPIMQQWTELFTHLCK